MYSLLTLKASTISCGQIVLVMAVPAEGAITLAIILYFAPSMASVRVRPVIPALAVEYWERKSRRVNASPRHQLLEVLTLA